MLDICIQGFMVATEGDDITSLGAWTGDDLAGTACANVGIGADADLPITVRFLAGVAKLVRRRLAEQGANTDPARPAIFLLEPNARPYKAGAQPKRVPMLDNGLTSVTGRLWFVSPVVVTGKYVELDDDDDETIFGVVTTSLELGAVPAIVFDPRTTVPTVRFYPHGLADAETCEAVGIAGSDVSLQRIYEAIEKVYQNCLVTPEAQARAGKLWVDGDKWWPSPQAEDVVQLYLRAGLTTAFPTCTVRHEQTAVPGRLDLEIEESDALDRSKVTRHAVLELKVLRSFRSSGTVVSAKDTLEWVESGVRQAASYRGERGALAAALCCFDMRQQHSGEKCFEHIRDLATGLTVDLKHWFIFGTSEQYREFMTGQH
jgi:hypothetical protein